MLFRRNRETPKPEPNPRDCGLQTLRTTEQRRKETVTKMVPDTSSPAYSEARRRQAEGSPNLSFDYYYAKANGNYVEQEVAVEKVTYLGTLTCRQMEKKDIDPMTAEDETPVDAAVSVGRTVAALYCRTCPYFGKDQLQAAQYDADVARVEHDAVDQILAAELARQEIATINRGLNLPPTQN